MFRDTLSQKVSSIIWAMKVDRVRKDGNILSVIWIHTVKTPHSFYLNKFNMIEPPRRLRSRRRKMEEKDESQGREEREREKIG